jgi:hypothetical protein
MPGRGLRTVTTASASGPGASAGPAPRWRRMRNSRIGSRWRRSATPKPSRRTRARTRRPGGRCSPQPIGRPPPRARRQEPYASASVLEDRNANRPTGLRTREVGCPGGFPAGTGLRDSSKGCPVIGASTAARQLAPECGDETSRRFAFARCEASSGRLPSWLPNKKNSSTPPVSCARMLPVFPSRKPRSAHEKTLRTGSLVRRVFRIFGRSARGFVLSDLANRRTDCLATGERLIVSRREPKGVPSHGN